MYKGRQGRLASLAYVAGLVSLVLAVALSPAGGVALAAPLAATAPGLGAAGSFSVLAALSASAAGAGTTISGDLGLSPGLAVSRTGPWTVGGTEYFGPLSLAADAQADALVAFGDLAGQPSSGVWGGAVSPAPGVWTDAGSPVFAGTLTLTGGPTDVWVFQISTDFTFSGSVSLTGGAQACNVFWQIGRDATIGVGSAFVGTLIASRDVTLVSGASVDGRILSLNGALTTDGNSISGPSCRAATSPGASHVSVSYIFVDNGRVAVTVGLSAGVTVTGLGEAITSAQDTGENRIVRFLPPGRYEWLATPPAGHYMLDTARGVIDTAAAQTPAPAATLGSAPAATLGPAPAATAGAGATPPVLLPVTGVDLAEVRALASRQGIRIGLGALGLGLMLLGFMLRRKQAE